MGGGVDHNQSSSKYSEMCLKTDDSHFVCPGRRHGGEGAGSVLEPGPLQGRHHRHHGPGTNLI